MMKHILAAICLLAATPAVAQNSSAILPPEYDFPYKGKLTVERTPYQHVVRQNYPKVVIPLIPLLLMALIIFTDTDLAV